MTATQQIKRNNQSGGGKYKCRNLLGVLAIAGKTKSSEMMSRVGLQASKTVEAQPSRRRQNISRTLRERVGGWETKDEMTIK